jgi:PAS domain S-box-containing protein
LEFTGNMDRIEKIHELCFIFDASHNGIMVIDKGGIIILYNLSAGRVLKTNPQYVIGKHISEVSPESWADFKGILQTGIPQIGRKVTIGNSTIVANRTPIVLNGNIIGVLSVFQDSFEYERIITELEGYKKINKELDAIIESSYDGLYVTDGNANTLRVNKAYQRITGLKAKDVVGHNMHELVEKGFFNQSVTIEVLKTRKPVTIMQDVLGGKKVMVTGNPIFNENGTEIMLVLTNVRDITELDILRKELEDSRRISERYLSELKELRLHNLSNHNFIVKSDKMKNVIHAALKVAEVDTSILITGETGVGKGVLAKIIHNNSHRSEKSFLKINCASFPETLLESELFGYTRGAFTGARTDGKPGLFEVADGGTIFLDEISEIPLNLQVKLLDVLEERQATRLGSTKPYNVDVRIIAASNRDIKKMVHEKKFREDLFYRLMVVPIHIPPLRERKEDMFPLINFFLEKYNRSFKKKKRILRDALDFLMIYNYPGNIRELKNIIERLVVMAESDLIGIENIPLPLLGKESSYQLPQGCNKMTLNIKRFLMRIEASLIHDAIKQCGTTYKAAKYLGINQSTVVRKIKKYNNS